MLNICCIKWVLVLLCNTAKYPLHWFLKWLIFYYGIIYLIKFLRWNNLFFDPQYTHRKNVYEHFFCVGSAGCLKSWYFVRFSNVPLQVCPCFARRQPISDWKGSCNKGFNWNIRKSTYHSSPKLNHWIPCQLWNLVLLFF